MSDLEKLAHAVWQCKYHVIWCPKYRFKILNGALQRSVGELLQQLCEWQKLEILEMNVQEGHVLLLLSIPPKENQQSRFLINILNTKKRYWGRHFWAKGYCVSTVGLDEKRIRQ